MPSRRQGSDFPVNDHAVSGEYSSGMERGKGKTMRMKAFVFAVGSAAALSLSASAGTVTLQQGSGYSGCTDSWVYSYSSGSNYDDHSYLRLHYHDHC